MTMIAEPSVISLLLRLRSGGNNIASGTGFVAMAPSEPHSTGGLESFAPLAVRKRNQGSSRIRREGESLCIHVL